MGLLLNKYPFNEINPLMADISKLRKAKLIDDSKFIDIMLTLLKAGFDAIKQ